ncbi:MAG: amidohydrolase family protein [Bacteroidota bacterium]
MYKRNFSKALAFVIAFSFITNISAQNFRNEDNKILENKQSYYEELNSFARTQKVYNTHSHMNVRIDPGDFTLDVLLKSSYVDWMGISHEKNSESIDYYISKVKHNSYYFWLEKSLQELYDIDEKISSKNWDDISTKLVESRKQNLDEKFLYDYCKYEKIILDNFKKPGVPVSDLDVFTSAFRVNSFFYGYSAFAKDHNGNSAIVLYNNGKEINNIDEYVNFMGNEIIKQKEKGAVAIKCALAYDRGLDFTTVEKEKAEIALSKGNSKLSDEEIKDFQDYLFFKLCEIAAGLDMPLQVHTGLAKLQKSNAMQLREAIELNHKTKFVLFHGSYPWLDDIFGLTHNYSNVYPDMCWLPLISTSAAERFLHEIIEVGIIDKVAWGGDSFTVEESYGALLAMRHVLAKVLSEKVEDGYLSMDEAKEIVKKVLYSNAKGLYSN